MHTDRRHDFLFDRNNCVRSEGRHKSQWVMILNSDSDSFLCRLLHNNPRKSWQIVSIKIAVLSLYVHKYCTWCVIRSIKYTMYTETELKMVFAEMAGTWKCPCIWSSLKTGNPEFVKSCAVSGWLCSTCCCKVLWYAFKRSD